MVKFLQGIILVLIVFLAFSAVTFFFNENLYEVLVQEDGFIEYTSAFLLLLCAVFFVVKVFKFKGERTKLWTIFNLILALGLFFGFGEEISWGQRIFSITTGDFFAENNLQNETNLHNLSFNGFKLNKWIFTYAISLVFGVYFLILPFLYKANSKIKALVKKFGIPVPKLIYVLIFIGVTLIIVTVSNSRKWEIWECLFGAVFLLIVIDPFNDEERFLNS